MPLSRHTVASEYALGGRDLYARADQRDPEAVLDGVAVAGLVGVLRQLGDLAEFAAEVFHGLYDEVMTSSARGHGLMLRVQQLEAELPLVEKDICQKDYLYVASNRGIDWHGNPRVEHGVVTTGDTPRFIMNSMKRCHGPPRLFMLDKYDIGGEGTCLKRYSDPAFFKTDSACSRMLQEGIRTERRPIRTMEIRPNLKNAEIFRPPNGANNDSEFMTDLSGEVLDEVPPRRQRLKYRQLNGSLFRSFKPQMQDLYEKASPEEKTFSMDRSEVQISFSDSPDTTVEERDIMVDTSSSTEKGKEGNFTAFLKTRSTSEETPSSCSEDRSAGSSKGYNSETDIYVDALTTMGSEVETDSEHKDHGLRAFSSAPSGKICSDAYDAPVSRSSTFCKEDLPMPYSSDVGSENGDMVDHYEEDVTVSVPHTKPVAGEHERTSSLEELFEQEKPVSCEHERTHSLEELLAGDVIVSEPDIRGQATEFHTNGIFSDTTSDGTVDTTRKAKGNNMSAITFKKMASKRCVEGMELFASKVGILPRKVSKRHDPFSDSLRNMAKELLELKCDGTQETDLYDYEANGEVFDIKCREISHPPVEIKEGSFRKSISSDSPQDDVGSREFQLDEVSQESDRDVPPTDSPHESVPDENGFQHADVYLSDITSPSAQEKEGCEGSAPGEHSSVGMLDHAPELIQEQTEDMHAEVLSQNASSMGEEQKEVCICEERVNEEDADECSESDEYGLDDETTEYAGEDVVADVVIFSPVSSKQSDDPCQVTPFTLTNADDTIASEGADNYVPEMVHIVTLPETITESELPQSVPESVISSEVAMPDNEQCYLRPETSFAPDTVLSSCEVVGQNEQLQLCSSSAMAATTDSTTNTEEIHELHQEPPNACNSSNTEHFADQMSPDSRHVPLPNISSFDWMLSGAMRQSLNVFPAQTSHGILHENRSSEDTEHAPPLPPLPPMQWRATKLQTGSTSLFAKLGKPPRPPMKHKGNDTNSALVEVYQESENLKEKILQNSFTSQKEMAQAEVSDEILTNPLLNRDSQENHLHEGCQEYDVHSSNIFSVSEVNSMADIALVEGDSRHTLQLPELIVIPEEAWSELAVDIEPILQQEKMRTQELRNGVSDCDGMHTTGLLVEENNVEDERSDQKDKKLPASDRNTIADLEENKQNVLPCKDDTESPQLSVQHEDRKVDSSEDKVREFSSVVEELAKINVEHETSDQNEKELPATDSNTIVDSEENKPNRLPCKDDIQTPDFSVQQGDGEHGSSDNKAKEFSSALEEELAKLPSDPVPEPPRYPLLQVISHDRSMLRKAPTLVQPSRKLSDEKNTMLEQIKNKSINLKPVVAKRPNVMGGPRTNLQVAAILERANAIRQAVADDDDEDSWSE